MTPRTRRLLLLCGLLPTLAVALASLLRPAVLAGLEYAVYDTVVRLTPARPVSGRVAIVDVDEQSLAELGQWPWRRDVVGRLVEKLRRLGAATVALDIVFAEPDRDGGTRHDPDVAFADALARHGAILGYGLLFDVEPETPKPCLQHAIGLPIVRSPGVTAGDPFFHATSAVCNLPELTEAAAGSGFLNAAPDPDGILRRAPLLAEYGGRIYPSLALAAVRAVVDGGDPVLRVANLNTTSLSWAGRTVSLDGRSNLLVRYRGPRRTFQYISAVDVLRDAVDADAVRDRIVFVGTTALGTREVVATPLDTLFVGVEVQATVADNLLQGDSLHRPEHALAAETQVVVGLGAFISLLVVRAGLAWAAAAGTLIVAGLWGTALTLMGADGAYYSPLYPSLCLVTSMAAMVVAGLDVERRRADAAGAEKATSHRLMVQTLLSLTGMRDTETGKHSRRTQRYARVIAEELARHPDYRAYLTPERIDLLSSLAPLHDIGKVGVPDRVLNKPGQLTVEEQAEMRRHPRYGREVLENAERAAGARDDAALAVAKDIVYTHHEWWDGSGYPEGLSGTAIPIPGRVMAVVDVYDAVTTRTLYKRPMSKDEAVAHILAGRGTHFDPAVVDAFARVADLLHALSEERDQ